MSVGSGRCANRRRRYQRAISTLNKAYMDMMELQQQATRPEPSAFARVHLWLGMCHNECHSFDGTEANKMALQHYAMAEQLAQPLPAGLPKDKLVASILNSSGVAHHHLAISTRDGHTHLPIPRQCAPLYKKALAFTRKHDKDAFMQQLQAIIESNMGAKTTGAGG